MKQEKQMEKVAKLLEEMLMETPIEQIAPKMPERYVDCYKALGITVDPEILSKAAERIYARVIDLSRSECYGDIWYQFENGTKERAVEFVGTALSEEYLIRCAQSDGEYEELTRDFVKNVSGRGLSVFGRGSAVSERAMDFMREQGFISEKREEYDIGEVYLDIKDDIIKKYRECGKFDRVEPDEKIPTILHLITFQGMKYK
ncbi:MAG: hypothetical protein KAT77_01175 [Nanoarchaeota archaeon]|nr:hypothetical protein [Nanoarchaeota archaeon]